MQSTKTIKSRFKSTINWKNKNQKYQHIPTTSIWVTLIIRVFKQSTEYLGLYLRIMWSEQDTQGIFIQMLK